MNADIAQQDITYAQLLDLEIIEEAIFDGVVEVVDGCTVEPDGTCPHGHRSPLLVLGLI